MKMEDVSLVDENRMPSAMEEVALKDSIPLK
jgi:hypothetical protein